MKAVLLGSSNSRNAGGLFNTVCALGHGLQQEGVDVSFLLHDDEHSPHDRARYGALPLHTYAVKGPRNFAYSPDLAGQLAGLRPDVVHTQGLWMYFSFVNNAYAARTRTPYIISPHGMLDPWQLRQSFAKDLKKRVALALYERQHLQRAACLQALCESEYESIRACGLQNPVALIPNGIDLPSPAVFASGRPVPSWHEAASRRTLLFLSRLHPKKGLAELLAGWALTKPAQHDWQLVVAGTAADEAYALGLQAQAQQLGVADTVRFVGGQFGPDKEASLLAADAFILPSFSEGLPMAVLEAWAYRLPVLITDFCNLPEGFASQAAIRIEPAPASIAHGIAQLQALPSAARAQMGQRGQALVAEKFTWPKVAAATRQLYEWVTGQGEQPACVRLQ